VKTRSCWVALLGLCLLTTPSFSRQKITKFDFSFGGYTRAVYAVIPDREGPMPLVLLDEHGCDVELTVIRNHDHNYYAISDQLNEKAWNFLKMAQMPDQDTLRP
jgi:hypothetical protein